MSYITGTAMDFENRMHQTCTGVSDLNSYVSEGRVYLTGLVISFNESGKWEREARRQKYSFTQVASSITGQIF